MRSPCVTRGRPRRRVVWPIAGRPVRRAVVCLVVAGGGLVAAGLPAAAASAAPAWLAPVNLSEAGQSALEPQVAVDAQGGVVAVWKRNSIIQASSRPAGGGWQTPVDLSEGVEPNTVEPYEPDVAMDGAGDAVAVWSFPVPGTGHVEFITQAAVRPAGAWQRAEDISAAGESNPQVAIDPRGDAIAVWTLYDGTSHNQIIQAASRPADGAWQPPVTLSEIGQNAYSPQVAVDPHGDAMVIWQSYNGTNYVAQAAYRPVGGSWQAAVDLSEAGRSAASPKVIFDPEGDAVAIWELVFNCTGCSRNGEIIQAAYRPVGGSWQAAVDLSEAGLIAEEAHVALDAQGNAVAVWERERPTNKSSRVIQAAYRPVGGSWQAAVDLSGEGESAGEPRVALDPQGDAIVVWDSLNGSEEYSVQTALRPAGGAWKTPVTLSEAGLSTFEPQVAYDPQGDAIVVWRSSSPASHLIVQAAAYDAAGPLLEDLSIPAAGTVGQPVSFFASPLDAWSALGVTKWSFGDGGSATGTSVTHAYAAVGAYQVTLTGEDALGNMSSASDTITISSVPGAGAEGSTGSSSGTGSSSVGGGQSQSSGRKLLGTISNAFSIVNVRTERDGTIVLMLKVSAAGRLSASARTAAMSRTRLHGRRRRTLLYGRGLARSRAAGLVELTIRPRHAALDALRGRRRPRVLIAVTFAPTGGAPHTEREVVTVGRD
jgi:hypothetical protein